MCVNVWWNLLKDSVVNQELCGQRSQQGDADSEAEAAAGAVERPPQSDGERRQRQRQLDVVGKVHFLTDGGSRTRQSAAVFTELLHVYHFTFNPVSLHQRSSCSLQLCFHNDTQDLSADWRIQHWRGWCQQTPPHSASHWTTPAWTCVARPVGCRCTGTTGRSSLRRQRESQHGATQPASLHRRHVTCCIV